MGQLSAGLYLRLIPTSKLAQEGTCLGAYVKTDRLILWVPDASHLLSVRENVEGTFCLTALIGLSCTTITVLPTGQ